MRSSGERLGLAMGALLKTSWLGWGGEAGAPVLPGGVAGVQAEGTPGAVSSASTRFPGL